MTAFAWLASITGRGGRTFSGLSAFRRWRLNKETARSAATGVLAEVAVLALSFSKFAEADRDPNQRQPGDRWPDESEAARPSPNLERRRP
jgi:hypothetical protein